MFARLGPVAILVWATMGAAVGLIIDLPVFAWRLWVDCGCRAALMLLMLWLEYERDEQSRE